MCGINTSLPVTVPVREAKSPVVQVTTNTQQNTTQTIGTGSPTTTTGGSDEDRTKKVSTASIPANQAEFPTKSDKSVEIDAVKSKIVAQSGIHGVSASELGKLIRTMKSKGIDDDVILKAMEDLLSEVNNNINDPVKMKSGMSEAIINTAREYNCKFHPDTIKDPFCYDATLTSSEAQSAQDNSELTAARQKVEKRNIVEPKLVVDKDGMVDVGKTLVKLKDFKFNFSVSAGVGKSPEAQTTPSATGEKPKAGFVDIFNALGAKLGIGLSFEKFSASMELKMNKEMFMKFLDNMGDAKSMDEAVKTLESFIKSMKPDFFEKIKVGSGSSSGEKQ